MKLEPLMTYHARLAATLDIGAGPYGRRMIFEVDGGAFEGARLQGIIRKAGGADWATVYEDFVHLDVRATFETHDGAFIYVEYVGRVELTPKARAALAGEDEMDYGDAYFFNMPRLQTGDPRYIWVNNLVCIGQGRFRKGVVEYEVFQVVN